MTIKDIAEIAQVSKGTVSRAINGQPGVGDKTRQRILKLAESLDFQPNSSAVALASNRTGNIGLVVPHEAEFTLGSFFWSTLIRSIAKRSILSKNHLLLLPPAEEGDISSAYRDVLKKRSIDGLIIGSEMLDQKAAAFLLMQEIPFVLLGQNPLIQHYCIDVNSYQGSSLMTAHLVEKGFKRIALLSGPAEYLYTQERIQGFKDVLSKAELDSSLVFSANYTPETQLNQLKKIADLGAPIDCLFIGAGGDFLLDAVQLIRDNFPSMLKIGFAVFDDYKFLNYYPPYITAVKQPLEEMANKSVDILDLLIKGEVPENKLYSLDCSLEVRLSTQPNKFTV